MVPHIEPQYKSISKHQIDELNAIYGDYLFISRHHERVLDTESLLDLARDQVEDMYSDTDVIPWEIRPVSLIEKHDFDNFVDNNISSDDTVTYVILRHTNPKGNIKYSKLFSVPPRTMSTIRMQLPSALECCSFVYPHGATFGNTEFFVNGLYKARYTHKKYKNQLLKDMLGDSEVLTELYMMMNLVDIVNKVPEQSPKQLMQDIKKASTNAYAAERLLANESCTLDILGSFAEKLLAICRNTYKTKDAQQALKMAQQDGLILSAYDFYEYINIRNFILHQWDTLDEAENFGLSKSEKTKQRRDEYLQSYLKFCDTTLYQRAKSYINALHQMQYVIERVNPDRIIRGKSESNTKFIQRIKTIYQQKPDVQIELNHPLANQKYFHLNKTVHKFFPNANVVDEYSDELKITEKQAKIDEYNMRSYFLQTFQSVESMVIRHCKIRGNDFDNTKSWKEIKKLGILTEQEFTIWQKYTYLRNDLSHSYFDDKLRQRLYECDDRYKQDLRKLCDKLISASPDVQRLYDDVYEYCHDDGLVIHFDVKNHKVVYNSMTDSQTNAPANYIAPQDILQQTAHSGNCR